MLAGTNPSNFYLTGYLGPRRKTGAAKRLAVIEGSEAAQEEQAEQQLEIQRSAEGMELGAPGPGNADDDGANERPPARSFAASSLGLTVLLPRDAKEIQARVTWGDYVTEPPLDEAVFIPEARKAAEDRGEKPIEPARNTLHWRRLPREQVVILPLKPGEEPSHVIVPDSAAPMSPGGALELVVSVHEISTASIDGVKRDLLAVSVFLVNNRSAALGRFGDLAFCFQARLQLNFPRGFEPRDDRASYDSQDFDERLADLHYRDVFSFAVGHNSSGDWVVDAEGRVTTVFTNPLPTQEVEKLGADIDQAGVVRSMEDLAQAADDVAKLDAALSGLPVAYAAWAQAQAAIAANLQGVKRKEIAQKCLDDIETARQRIESGIVRLKGDPISREAFGIMNRVMARSNCELSLGCPSDPSEGC